MSKVLLNFFKKLSGFGVKPQGLLLLKEYFKGV